MTWTRHGTILTPTQSWESYLVEEPSPVYDPDDGLYRIFYTGSDGIRSHMGVAVAANPFGPFIKPDEYEAHWLGDARLTEFSVRTLPSPQVQYCYQPNNEVEGTEAAGLAKAWHIIKNTTNVPTYSMVDPAGDSLAQSPNAKWQRVQYAGVPGDSNKFLYCSFIPDSPDPFTEAGVENLAPYDAISVGLKIRGSQSGVSVNLFVVLRAADGTPIGLELHVPVALSADAQVVKYENLVLPDDAACIQMGLYVSGISNGDNFDIEFGDQVINKGATLIDYFDGDTVDGNPLLEVSAETISRTPDGVYHCFYGSGGYIRHRTSQDKGMHWSDSVVIIEPEEGENYNQNPRLTVDPDDGTCYLLWENGTSGDICIASAPDIEHLDGPWSRWPAPIIGYGVTLDDQGRGIGANRPCLNKLPDGTWEVWAGCRTLGQDLEGLYRFTGPNPYWLNFAERILLRHGEDEGEGTEEGGIFDPCFAQDAHSQYLYFTAIKLHNATDGDGHIKVATSPLPPRSRLGPCLSLPLKPVVVGDGYYDADDRAIWLPDPGDWPLLGGATITATLQDQTVACSIGTGADGVRFVWFDACETLTGALCGESFRWKVAAALADGHLVTLGHGTKALWTPDVPASPPE